jgi:ATP-binding cassette, subfamily C (CFTR/MRP), member 4
MVSTERVFEYTHLPSEAATETDVKAPKGWPTQGKLQIKNMSLTYPNLKDSSTPLPPVLKNISVEFEAGIKIGILGRTGAGKSSFLQALFRIVEPTPEKSIIIDDIAMSDLGLADLRSNLSIIPQEPFCFKGTLRFNLDPFKKHTDEELWTVLEAVELKVTIEATAEKLETAVLENGSNWSVGERQLICLARAILRNTRFIVLDEATSNVDIRTDQLIQNAIRSEGGLFSNATVLTIAHRLNTVIDYDKILVLEAGEVAEYGSPWELLEKNPEDPTAWFLRLVNEMGEDAKQVLIKVAQEKKQKLQ